MLIPKHLQSTLLISHFAGWPRIKVLTGLLGRKHPVYSTSAKRAATPSAAGMKVNIENSNCR